MKSPRPVLFLPSSEVVKALLQILSFISSGMFLPMFSTESLKTLPISLSATVTGDKNSSALESDKTEADITGEERAQLPFLPAY